MAESDLNAPPNKRRKPDDPSPLETPVSESAGKNFIPHITPWKTAYAILGTHLCCAQICVRRFSKTSTFREI